MSFLESFRLAFITTICEVQIWYWNMFLALLALDFSLLSYCIKQKVVRWSSGLLWLFFYPNTFYMLTDIVHMNFTDSVLWNKTSLILYMLYVSSILFGVLCGIESVKNIVVTFKLKIIISGCFSL